jgi:hypothetical protein
VICIFYLTCLLGTTELAQTPKQVAPVPGDPLELATGPVRVADTADKRASILALLERARQNTNLHAPGSAPYDLKVSFTSNGQSLYTGIGETEEIWAAPSSWRWTAHLADYSQERVYYHGIAYDANAHAYMPLRLQMVRQAIFLPIAGNFANSMIRVAKAHWNGIPLTCVLVSNAKPLSSDTQGRQWDEEEFCVDPKSGLLQTYSIAPGTYDVYDYTNPLEFHGRTLARQISIVENGTTVVQIQLDSVQDFESMGNELFKPTPGMHGPGAIITAPLRLRQLMRGGADSASAVVQPVIVRAALDESGKVLEAEVLQVSDPSLSDAALQLVKNTNYGPARGGPTPLQREIFVNVQSRPTQ